MRLIAINHLTVHYIYIYIDFNWRNCITACLKPVRLIHAFVRSRLALTHLSSCLMCLCQGGQVFMKISYWGKSIQLHGPFTLNKLICLHKTARHRGASGACYALGHWSPGVYWACGCKGVMICRQKPRERESL